MEFTVINFFYYTLLKKSTELTIFITQRLRRRRQTSIVRKLGPLLFWIKAQRIYLVWKNNASEDSSTYSDNDSESTLSSCPWTDTPTLESNGSNEMGAKIEEMQKEITNLQAQLSEIISKMAAGEENKFSLQEESILSSTSFRSAQSTPPLPPPPPPLPSLWSNNISVIVKVRQDPESHGDKPDRTTCSIVEELATKPPKLRHVERSPGGRPVRSNHYQTPDNSSDILTAVLKKRFKAIHSP